MSPKGDSASPAKRRKSVIEHYSNFFKAALSKGFKEGDEKLVRLPEVKADLFETYVQWIYQETIVTISPEEAEQDHAGAKRGKMLGRVYIMADRFGDTRLHNATIDELIRLRIEVGKASAPDTVSLAYEETPAGSTLRKYLVASLRGKRNADWFKTWRASLPTDFIFDVLHYNLLAGDVAGKLPEWEDRCTYHEHSKEVPKCT